MKKWLLMSTVIAMSVSLTACNSGSKPAANNNAGQSAPKQEAGSNSQGAKQAESKYPEKPLNWTIAFGPGGGNDIMSRMIVDILKKNNLYTKDIIVDNKAGGSGAVGWGFLNSHKGDPYYISSTSGSFITTPLVSNAGFTYESFTPVALMATDDMVLLVRQDSPYNTLDDFVKAAKGAQKKLSVGGIGAVNVDAILPQLLAKAGGFEIEYVPFQAEGELTSALLSKSIDAKMSNPAEALGQIKAGKMKPLAFSGKERISQLKDVPTFIELGYKNVTLPMPRGIILAGNVSPEIQQWWIDTMKKVVETPEWKKYINDNSLTENVLFGEDFKKYLTDTTKTFETILKETGNIKK